MQLSSTLFLACSITVVFSFNHEFDGRCDGNAELPLDALRTISNDNDNSISSGNCVRLTECPTFRELLTRRPVGFLDFIEHNLCGVTGRVPLYCCPSSDDFLPQLMLPSTVPRIDESEEDGSSSRDERSAVFEELHDSTTPTNSAEAWVINEAFAEEDADHQIKMLPEPAKLVNTANNFEFASDAVVFEDDDDQFITSLIDRGLNKQDRGHRGRGKISFFGPNNPTKPGRPSSGRVIFRDNDLPVLNLPGLLITKPSGIVIVNPPVLASTKPPTIITAKLPGRTTAKPPGLTTTKLPQIELVEDPQRIVFDDDSNSAPSSFLTSTPAVKTTTTATPSVKDATTPSKAGRLDEDPLDAKRTLLPNATSDSYWDRCGLPGLGRIVGGSDTGVGKYPWMVRLGYKDVAGVIKGELDFRCAGTAINEKYVLTAAHCVPTDGSKLVVARFGEYDDSSNPDCLPGSPLCTDAVKDMAIDLILPHKFYNQPKPLQNDIALLRLKEAVETSDFIRPVCLPFGLDSRVPRSIEPRVETPELLAAGWGSLGSGLGYSQTLKEVALPVFDQTKCSKVFSGKIEISDLQLCAGGVSGKDACEGDSGGPLMMRDDEGLYNVVGVVSFGPKMCGTSGLPGVYTRVTRYLRWILENIEP